MIPQRAKPENPEPVSVRFGKSITAADVDVDVNEMKHLRDSY